MFRSLLIGVFLFFSGFVVKAQTSNSLLWEISGNGLSKPSYLYGTIHLIAQDDFFVRKEIDSVFNLCEQLAFEIKLDDPAILQLYQDWILLPSGKTLKDFCTEEEYQILKQYLLDSAKTDIETIMDQKPFMLTQLQISDYITGQPASFEIYFFQESIKKNVPVFGLENLQDELDLLDVIPYEEQIDMVINNIKSSSQNQKTWDELIAAYKEEDIDKLYEISLDVTPELIKYENLFLDNRNIKWIPVIDTLIKERSTFIAVGAAHLSGENGVIQLLKNQGYILKKL